MTPRLPIAPRGFSHVGITASDIDASIDFYTNVLGFRLLIDARTVGSGRALLAIDDLALELFDGPAGPEVQVPEETTFGHPKLALTVADLDGVRAALAGGGVPFWGDIVVTEVSRILWIRDPDGVPIQLTEFDGGYTHVRQLLEQPAAG
jgi:catechol 2,3-dioxygenase-like lactoylglutathione lyase family enzyme